ncbi:speckle-type POZ protein B-like [Planococcus citri]|uniref:speckle-type POZ protein B-like n=1 Tax=Planococcus citri TaxID=170843 RepID=UPI0031F9F405
MNVLNKNWFTLFSFAVFIFIQHQPTNAASTILSQRKNLILWNADAKFRTIKYNWTAVPLIGCTVIDIPTTEDETYKWTVKSYFHYMDKCLSLSFQLNDDGKIGNVIAKFKATLYDKQMNEVRSQEELRELPTVVGCKTREIKWEKFFTNTEFDYSKLIHERITISVEIIFYYYSRCTNIPSERNVTKCYLSDNLGSLLGDTKFADAVLYLNNDNKEYPVHRAILASRSPVFANIFEDIYKSGQNYKHIRINTTSSQSINEEIMNETLRYIYTGKCEKLNELAEGLFSAANNFQLDELKTLSSQSMIEAISVENAANVLVLADKYHDEDLKSKTMEFIVENVEQVFNTTEWKSTVASNAQLLNEMCQLFARLFSKWKDLPKLL